MKDYRVTCETKKGGLQHWAIDVFQLQMQRKLGQNLMSYGIKMLIRLTLKSES